MKKELKELVITKNNIEEVTSNLQEYININLRVEDVEMLTDIKKAVKNINNDIKIKNLKEILVNKEIKEVIEKYFNYKNIEVVQVKNISDNIYKLSLINRVIPFSSVLNATKEDFKEIKLFFKAFTELSNASVINALQSEGSEEKCKKNYFKDKCNINKFNTTLSNNNILNILTYLFQDICKFENIKVNKKTARFYTYSLTLVKDKNKVNVNTLRVQDIIQICITILQNIIENDEVITINGK